jgi:hypothetical protein
MQVRGRPPRAPLRETLTQARREMASMMTLAQAMTSVRGDGRSGVLPAADGQSGNLQTGAFADLEAEVFKDLVCSASQPA